MDETKVAPVDGSAPADPSTNPAPVVRDSVGNLLDPNDRTAPVVTSGSVAQVPNGEGNKRTPNPQTITAQNTVTSLVKERYVRKGDDGVPVLTLLAVGADGKPTQRQVPLSDFAGVTAAMVQKAEEELDPLAAQRRTLAGVIAKLKKEGLTDEQVATLLGTVVPPTVAAPDPAPDAITTPDPAAKTGKK